MKKVDKEENFKILETSNLEKDLLKDIPDNTPLINYFDRECVERALIKENFKHTETPVNMNKNGLDWHYQATKNLSAIKEESMLHEI